MPRRDQPEYRLQCAIADTIRLREMPGLYWTALPFGEKRTPETGARLKRMGVRPGAADILLMWRSRGIYLELKVEGGRQNDNQKSTQADWTLAGGLYHVATGYQEAISFLEMLGVLKPDRSVIKAKQVEMFEGKAA